MKRKITHKYIQCKEAYLDGFEDGFQRACHLGEISKQVEYREPKKYWYIDDIGVTHEKDANGTWTDEYRREIGNYFESEEEAERAVEKLKAYKRLKVKGLYVTTFYVEDGSLVIRAKTHNSSGAENWDDLDLLFGGEE